MRHNFTSPLARWGFTVCALLSIATAQPAPFLISTVLAAYAWLYRR